MQQPQISVTDLITLFHKYNYDSRIRSRQTLQKFVVVKVVDLENTNQPTTTKPNTVELSDTERLQTTLKIIENLADVGQFLHMTTSCIYHMWGVCLQKQQPPPPSPQQEPDAVRSCETPECNDPWTIKEKTLVKEDRQALVDRIIGKYGQQLTKAEQKKLERETKTNMCKWTSSLDSLRLQQRRQQQPFRRNFSADKTSPLALPTQEEELKKKENQRAKLQRNQISGRIGELFVFEHCPCVKAPSDDEEGKLQIEVRCSQDGSSAGKLFGVVDAFYQTSPEQPRTVVEIKTYHKTIQKPIKECLDIIQRYFDNSKTVLCDDENFYFSEEEEEGEEEDKCASFTLDPPSSLSSACSLSLSLSSSSSSADEGKRLMTIQRLKGQPESRKHRITENGESRDAKRRKIEDAANQICKNFHSQWPQHNSDEKRELAKQMLFDGLLPQEPSEINRLQVMLYSFMHDPEATTAQLFYVSLPDMFKQFEVTVKSNLVHPMLRMAHWFLRFFSWCFPTPFAARMFLELGSERGSSPTDSRKKRFLATKWPEFIAQALPNSIAEEQHLHSIHKCNNTFVASGCNPTWWLECDCFFVRSDHSNTLPSVG